MGGRTSRLLGAERLRPDRAPQRGERGDRRDDGRGGRECQDDTERPPIDRRPFRGAPRRPSTASNTIHVPADRGSRCREQRLRASGAQSRLRAPWRRTPREAPAAASAARDLRRSPTASTVVIRKCCRRDRERDQESQRDGPADESRHFIRVILEFPWGRDPWGPMVHGGRCGSARLSPDHRLVAT